MVTIMNTQMDAEGLGAAIEAYNAIWKASQNIDASTVDAVRRAAISAALQANKAVEIQAMDTDLRQLARNLVGKIKECDNGLEKLIFELDVEMISDVIAPTLASIRQAEANNRASMREALNDIVVIANGRDENSAFPRSSAERLRRLSEISEVVAAALLNDDSHKCVRHPR